MSDDYNVEHNAAKFTIQLHDVSLLALGTNPLFLPRTDFPIYHLGLVSVGMCSGWRRAIFATARPITSNQNSNQVILSWELTVHARKSVFRCVPAYAGRIFVHLRGVGPLDFNNNLSVGDGFLFAYMRSCLYRFGGPGVPRNAQVSFFLSCAQAHTTTV